VRELLTLVVPLALPTVLYVLWLQAARWAGSERARRAMPWLWLAGTGVVLLAVVLFVVTVGFGTSQTGTYVPPQLHNGRIVPGHIVPEPRP
jgi:hypothetical protein